MKVLHFAILVVAALSAYAGAESDDSQARCDKLFNLIKKGISLIPPPVKAMLTDKVKQSSGIDIMNDALVRKFACHVAGAKTLKDLTIDVKVPYPMIQMQYNKMTSELAAFGGYTNADRLVELALDIREWANSLTPGDSPAESTDLPKLTSFLEKMQVKYGSRWLSYPTFAKNLPVLIEDPKETAKELFACQSIDDVEKLLNVSTKGAKNVFTLILTRSSFNSFLMVPINIFEFAGEAVNTFAELGLFTLPQ